jgi:hypothetical protein
VADVGHGSHGVDGRDSWTERTFVNDTLEPYIADMLLACHSHSPGFCSTGTASEGSVSLPLLEYFIRTDDTKQTT